MVCMFYCLKQAKYEEQIPRAHRNILICKYIAKLKSDPFIHEDNRSSGQSFKNKNNTNNKIRGLLEILRKSMLVDCCYGFLLHVVL